MKNQKKLGILIVTFIFFAAFYHQAKADDPTGGTCGNNCTYTIDNGGNVIISGSGKVDVLENLDYSSVTNITFAQNSNFTSIGTGAFQNMTSLTDINIPDSMVSIGYAAFRNATSLAHVRFGENSQLTQIGDAAFHNATALVDINLPDSVWLFGGNAFSYTSSLEGFIIPNSLSHLAQNVFTNSGLTKIYCSSTQESDGGICSSASLNFAGYTGNIFTYEKDGNNYVAYDEEGEIAGVYSSLDDMRKDNVVTSYTTNKNGLITEYDGRGNINSISKYDGAGNLVVQYDKDGKLIYAKTIYTPAEAAAATKPKGNTVSITW